MEDHGLPLSGSNQDLPKSIPLLRSCTWWEPLGVERSLTKGGHKYIWPRPGIMRVAKEVPPLSEPQMELSLSSQELADVEAAKQTILTTYVQHGGGQVRTYRTPMSIK